MSRFEKLLQKIRSLDNNMRFEELRKVLESYGYEMKESSGGSSHATFRKEGKMPITIPRHGPVKKVYILLVKEAVESEEGNNEEN